MGFPPAVVAEHEPLGVPAGLEASAGTRIQRSAKPAAHKKLRALGVEGEPRDLQQAPGGPAFRGGTQQMELCGPLERTVHAVAVETDSARLHRGRDGSPPVLRQRICQHGRRLRGLARRTSRQGRATGNRGRRWHTWRNRRRIQKGVVWHGGSRRAHAAPEPAETARPDPHASDAPWATRSSQAGEASSGAWGSASKTRGAASAAKPAGAGCAGPATRCASCASPTGQATKGTRPAAESQSCATPPGGAARSGRIVAATTPRKPSHNELGTACDRGHRYPPPAKERYGCGHRHGVSDTLDRSLKNKVRAKSLFCSPERSGLVGLGPKPGSSLLALMARHRARVVGRRAQGDTA